MTERNKITIAEYAEKTGISKQAVYKKLKTSLQQYLIIDEDGKKMLDAKCLESIQPVEQPFQPKQTTVEQPVSDAEKDKIIQTQAETISSMQQQIKELETHILSQSAELTDVIKKNQTLQEQLIQLSAIPQLKELKEHSTVEQPFQPIVEQPLKKGFFSRFRKKG